MTPLTAYIEGIGLLGPGLANWQAAQAVLTNQTPYVPQPSVLPAPAALPPAERRRCGPIIKISIAVGSDAAAHAGRDLVNLPSVFSASGADGDILHGLCETLASDDRQISPTRFHNSVHNAASGYWSIATGNMATSSVVCAHDASFGAGLLEALTQVVVDHTPVLLVSCDTPYPQPLHAARPLLDAFGVGLLIAPQKTEKSLAQIRVSFTADAASQMTSAELEHLRLAVPAARSLPMLQAIAAQKTKQTVIDYLGSKRLAVEVQSCS